MDELKDRIRGLAASTHGPEVIEGGSSFAGLFQMGGDSGPVLVASTDGVGTKLKIAAQLGHFESIGRDLVTLNVNDILTKGARPLFFLDYVAFSDVDSQSLDSLMRGIAWGCREAQCALIGGETAQMPGVYADGEMDLAGFVVGVVKRENLLEPGRVREGDQLLGIRSSGLHTNGYSLVRSVFNTDDDPAALFRQYDGMSHQLGEELLQYHRSYYPMLAPALGLLSGLAHITGGGLPGKLPAVLPDDLAATISVGSWTPPPIFALLQREGGISDDEMFRVFNMGLGMVAVCPESNVTSFRELIPEAFPVGQVVRWESGDQVILA
ncbi:Phosphoribosylformylglycinamidine cyclo-ligase [Geodia barretti]|uniref:phosphoribosylformylglycinamidine cyclo-ligase n=1 Tax=Geodia barretti TaxID=519541 RepID=A0AA35SPV2_GEOBA|nr:Phosphoribosylformylglycinamidine cyclo-ligase [Geodia barretti]